MPVPSTTSVNLCQGLMCATACAPDDIQGQGILAGQTGPVICLHSNQRAQVSTHLNPPWDRVQAYEVGHGCRLLPVKATDPANMKVAGVQDIMAAVMRALKGGQHCRSGAGGTWRMAGPEGEACSRRRGCPRGLSPSTGSCSDSSDGGSASGAALGEPQEPKYLIASPSTCQWHIHSDISACRISPLLQWHRSRGAMPTSSACKGG